MYNFNKENTQPITYGLQLIICLSRRLFSLMALKNKVALCLTGLLCFMLFNLSTAWAQSAESRTAEGQTVINPLQIGDTIPEELWNLPLQVVNHPEGEDTITLNDYSNKKLVVLDFWATWCAPCIRSLYKLDTLQNEFKDIAIIPITYEPSEEIEGFLTDREINLPSVVLDKIMKEIFPHQSVPHQVWLKEGKVLTVTGHQSANEANFQKVVAGEEMKIIPKDGVQNFNADRPLTLLNGIKDVQNMHFMSTLLPRIDARISATRMYGNTEFVMYNMTIPSMLTRVFLRHLPMSAQNETRIRFDMPPTLKSRISPNDRKLTGDFEEDTKFFQWADSFQFCYYLYSNEKISESERLEFVKTDLNRYFNTMFGITGRTAVVPTKCIYLEKNHEYRSLKSEGGESRFDVKDGYLTMKNKDIGALVSSIRNYYNRTKRSSLPVVDFTGLDYKIDLEIPLERISDIETLKRSLLSVGIEIKEGTKPIEMLIISDNHN